MRKNAVTIDGEESPAVAGPRQEAAIGSKSKGVDHVFALGSFIEHGVFHFRDGCILGVFGRCLRRTPRDAKDAAAGFGASDEISFCVKSQNANVRFVAGVEKLAFAVGPDGEDLSFVTGGDIKSSVGRKSEVPDVFRFGFEENGFLAGSRDPVNLAVGRSADIESAFGVKGDGLRGEIRGIENVGRFAVRIEAKYFRRRTGGSVEHALRIESYGPKIGKIGRAS